MVSSHALRVCVAFVPTNSNVASSAALFLSDCERLLRQERPRLAEREQVRRLARWQSGPDACMEGAIRSLERTVVPDLQHLFGERAVVVPIH